MREHLESEEIAAYLDGVLDPVDRPRVEEHLEDCDACRLEIIEGRRWLDSAPRASRRKAPSVAALAGIGMAAAAAALMLWVPRDRLSSPPGEVVRSEQPTVLEGLPTIAVVSPVAGAEVAREDLAFSWRSAGEGSFYRLTVTDAKGRVRWTVSTADTVLVAPSAADLPFHETLFWHVDALLSDGRTATTRIQRVIVVP